MKPTGSVISPRLVAYAAAVLLLCGGIVNATNLLLTDLDGARFFVTGAASLGAFASSIMWWQFGQRGFGRVKVFVHLGTTLVLIGAGNWAGPEPYSASVFLFVLACWIGISLPRWTSVAVSPAIALAFWLPLAWAEGAIPVSASAVLWVVAGSVMTGETIAWLRDHLESVQRRLAQSHERRFEAFVSAASDAVLVTDEQGRVTHVSEQLSRMTGNDPAGVVGRKLVELILTRVHPAERSDVMARVEAVLATPGAERHGELRMARADEGWVDVEFGIRNLIHDDAVRGLLVSFRDIGDRKSLERSLARQAYCDPLTGLANRARFRERLHAATNRAEHVAVLFCDLDGFKAINDTLGHAEGDELLRLVAERLGGVVRPTDTLARLGGDEFAVLIEEETTASRTAAGDAGRRIAEAMLAAFAQPFALHGRRHHVSVSIGIASGGPGDDPGTLMRHADTAMYQAKQDGKDRYATYDAAMSEAARARMLIQGELRAAVAEDQLRLVFQPVVSTESLEVRGLEALVRWQHPTRGLLSPAEFIDVAEETGAILSVGRWVLREACREACRLRTVPGHSDLVMSVNLSPVQLQQADLVAEVRAALEDSGLPASSLVLEVTENVLLADPVAAQARLRALKDLGVDLAIDDFGTGYSALGYLDRFPFDILKIDRAFAQRILSTPATEHVVSAIVALGAGLGLAIVAEGIEHPDQHERLLALGCTRAQGYLYGRPMSAEALLAELAVRPGRLPATAAPVRPALPERLG